MNTRIENLIIMLKHDIKDYEKEIELQEANLKRLRIIMAESKEVLELIQTYKVDDEVRGRLVRAQVFSLEPPLD